MQPNTAIYLEEKKDNSSFFQFWQNKQQTKEEGRYIFLSSFFSFSYLFLLPSLLKIQTGPNCVSKSIHLPIKKMPIHLINSLKKKANKLSLATHETVERLIKTLSTINIMYMKLDFENYQAKKYKFWLDHHHNHSHKFRVWKRYGKIQLLFSNSLLQEKVGWWV